MSDLHFGINLMVLSIKEKTAKINKFSYLLGQLKGTALLVVSQLAVT